MSGELRAIANEHFGDGTPAEPSYDESFDDGYDEGYDEPTPTVTYSYRSPGSEQYVEQPGYDDPAVLQALEQLQAQEELNEQYREWANSPVTEDSVFTNGDILAMEAMRSQSVAEAVGPIWQDLQHVRQMDEQRQQMQEQATLQADQQMVAAGQQAVSELMDSWVAGEPGAGPANQQATGLLRSAVEEVVVEAVSEAIQNGADPVAIRENLAADPEVRRRVMLEARERVGFAYAGFMAKSKMRGRR